MNQIIRYLAVISALLTISSAFAQKKWTLEECISYALQNNIQLKREVLQSEKLKKDKLEAIASFTPSLEGQFTHKIQIGRVFSTNSGGFVTNPQEGYGGVGGSIDVFQGLSKWNYLSGANFDLLASIEGIEELRRNISINVTAKYLEVLYAKENLILAKNRVEVSEKQIESSKSQYELGKISSSDFMQIKSQAIDEKVQLTNAQNKFDLLSLELAQLLELSDVENFEIYSENIIVPSDSLKMTNSQYFDEAMLLSPSIKKAKFSKKSADKKYLVALGRSLPSISLNYELYSFYSDQVWIENTSGTRVNLYPGYSFREQLNDNVQKFISLQVSIPIYGRLQNYVKISKAKIDKLDAQFALEESQKNLKKVIQQAYADVKGSYSSYESLSESAKAYNEVFEASKEKFNLGMINAVDYGIARNNLIKAQGDLLHAKYSYIFKLKILDFYRGVPISL